MIGRLKAIAKRHWPRLRLRTILLSTFILVAALPGFGALFLRVYENAVVRQTETELTAQASALAAAAAAAWPGYKLQLPSRSEAYLEQPVVDLGSSPILADRPVAMGPTRTIDRQAATLAARIEPVLVETQRLTSANILLLDRRGIVLNGTTAGLSYADLPEVRAALNGRSTTTLRRNDAYRQALPVEWLNRSANLRLHHARPIRVNGRVVGALLLARAPPPLYMGLYEDAGKIAFGFALILLAIFVLSGLLSRGIIRPIEQLSLATRDLARGRKVMELETPNTAAVEIQALYADFAAMGAAIEQRSRYLRDFAHAMSHEFKTPLAGIRGAIELLQDHHAGMSDEERRRFLANAGMDAERLTGLVTRLLELARADMMPAGCEASDVGSALRRVADAYSRLPFRVELATPPELPPAAVPASTIETVLDTLIDNSRQAGATLCSVRVHLIESRIELRVSDNGPGVAPADRPRLFEPFFTTRRAAGGTGLGLSIARSLLHACSGSIRFADDGSLTQFIILLPISLSEQAPSAGIDHLS